jgi:hypothetical protein
MRASHILVVGLLLTPLFAKEPRRYQSGTLLKMESVKCGTDEKNGKSFAGEIIGTDSSHMKTQELLCQQYSLATDNMLYVIRPKEDKHPALLPVGEKAQFRMDKDKMKLRVEDLDGKERDYIVISVAPKADGKAPSAPRP